PAHPHALTLHDALPISNHDKRCNAGSKATEGIHNDCQPVHIDTGQAGSLTVTAERIDFTAQIGFVHDHPTEDDKSGKDNDRDGEDRKSTRLNSSHVSIS